MRETISAKRAAGQVANVGRTGSDSMIVAAAPRLRDRVIARWQAPRLDRELAAGEPAEASAPRALRARRLTAVDRRRSMAEAIRRIVDSARAGGPRSRVRIDPVQGRVRAADAELSSLAEALAEPGPVAARGVAQTQLLLSDGSGPLYNPELRASLRGLAAMAQENLQARFEPR